MTGLVDIHRTDSKCQGRDDPEQHERGVGHQNAAVREACGVHAEDPVWGCSLAGKRRKSNVPKNPDYIGKFADDSGDLPKGFKPEPPCPFQAFCRWHRVTGNTP
jgi:hypothetical protein